MYDQKEYPMSQYLTKEDRDEDMQKDRSKRAIRMQNKKRFDKEKDYE